MSHSDERPDDFPDDTLFRDAVGGVEPLKTKRKVPLKREGTQDLNAPVRRRAAEDQPEATADGLTGDYVHAVTPYDILEFKRPGVQHGVFRNLRLGKYSIDAHLDLHRMSVNQARDAVGRFVRDCIEHDIRCALITHGKGAGRDQPALLKSCVAHWLPQLESVLAFHTAQKHHGGGGATYVLLKKSDRKRQENLERHQKRRD